MEMLAQDCAHDCAREEPYTPSRHPRKTNETNKHLYQLSYTTTMLRLQASLHLGLSTES